MKKFKEIMREGSVQDKLYQSHQELRKKSGLPHPDYYKELGQSYNIKDDQERYAKQAEIRKKHGIKEESELDEARFSGAKMNKHFVYNRQHDPDDEDVSKLNVEPKDPYHKAKMERLRAGLADLRKTTFKHVKEDLRNWFNPKHPEGGWKRINSKGEAIGPCAREPGEGKPKCMSNEKRASLTKKERAAAVRAKRKHDPNPERKGEPINVSNYGKGKISENIEPLDEKNVPTSPEKWAQAKAQAKAKFDVYPSAYANGWASKKYKEMGGGWKSVKEEKDDVGEMIKDKLKIIINRAQEMHDGIDSNTDMPEWVKSKITLAQDYISTACDYSCGKEQLGEESDNLQEGRPSQRHPLEGHEYHRKSNEELIGIAKDAHKAAEAMKGHNTQAENKYRDQANDSATVRYFRQKNGMPDWYKKKYGHMKEENKIDEQHAETGRFHPTVPHNVANTKTPKPRHSGVQRNVPVQSESTSLRESRKAEIVKDIIKKKKSEQFNKDPEITDSLIKTTSQT